MNHRFSRITCAFAFLFCSCAPIFSAEPDSKAIDANANALPAAVYKTFSSLFPAATILKVEEKKSFNPVGLMMLDMPNARWTKSVEVTVSNELNPKFKVHFDSNGGLMSADKYKVQAELLPPAVKTALDGQTQNPNWIEPAEVKIVWEVKNNATVLLYSVSCKNSDKKKVKIEVYDDGTLHK